MTAVVQIQEESKKDSPPGSASLEDSFHRLHRALSLLFTMNKKKSSYLHCWGAADAERDKEESSSLCQSCRQQRETLYIYNIDPYHVLQIRRDATVTEIQQSYKKLALLHHPGRQQQYDCYDFFQTLAACYQVLTDEQARKTYDELVLQQQQQQSATIWTGQVHVGGKRLLNNKTHHGVSNHHAIFSCVKTNHTTATAAAGMSHNDDNEPTFVHVEDIDKNVRPTLMRSSSSSSSSSSTSLSCFSSDDNLHYTTDDTNRLFGGPHLLLYKARHYRAFRDPYDVFDSVVGSSIFSKARGMGDSCVTEQRYENNNNNKASWTGSTRTLLDGTVIVTTTRTTRDRIFTRTTSTKTDKKTGRKITHVSVTSQDVDGYEQEQNSGDTPYACPACGCGNMSPATEYSTTTFGTSRSIDAEEHDYPVSTMMTSDTSFETTSESYFDKLRNAFCVCGQLFPE